MFLEAHNNTVMQSQQAVSAYFTSKQMQSFAIAEQKMWFNWNFHPPDAITNIQN